MTSEKLIEIMKSYTYLERDLELVQNLGLPNWYMAAGYVRNRVWDWLHSYADPTPLNDIDVIYFDEVHQDEHYEKELESYLNEKTGLTIWSVKNQARMYIQNNDEPYDSIAEAVSRWPETVTAIGISRDDQGEIKLIAPYGVGDIFAMRVRRSPLFTDRDYYQRRLRNKNWQVIWPKLEIDWEEVRE